MLSLSLPSTLSLWNFRFLLPVFSFFFFPLSSLRVRHFLPLPSLPISSPHHSSMPALILSLPPFSPSSSFPLPPFYSTNLLLFPSSSSLPSSLFPLFPFLLSPSTLLIHSFPLLSFPSYLQFSDSILQSLHLSHVYFLSFSPLYNLHTLLFSSFQYMPPLISFSNLYFIILFHLFSSHPFSGISGSFLS